MSASLIPLSPAKLTSNYSHSAANSPWPITGCILASDFLSLSLVFAVAVVGRHLITPTYQVDSYFELLPFLAMMLGGFWIQGLYPAVLLHPAEEMRRIFIAITTVFLVMACSAFLSRNVDAYSRSVFLLTWAAGAPLVLLARYAIRRKCRRYSWWGISAVVLGSGPIAQRVSRTLQDGRWGVRVTGVLSDDPGPTWAADLPPFLGPLTGAPLLAESHSSEYAIVAMPQKSQQEVRRIIQDYCQGFRRVLLVPDMPGLCSLGVVAREIGGEVAFEVPQRLFQRGPAITKRMLDIFISATALCTLSPLFLFLSIAVKLSSKGPIFYGQDRYGRDNRIFKAFKFRSMVPDAARVLTEHLAAHPEDLFEWQRDHKLKNDPRVTRIGKLIRKLSLDELPQLWNVLVGQMSLVGPRPIVQAEIPKYGRSYLLYSRVRPGITGLWQVSGRNNTTYEERVTLDEYYVNNWSVWIDCYILLRTVKTVLKTEGAY